MQIHFAVASTRRPLPIANEDVGQLSLLPADLRILIVNQDMRSADRLKYTLSELGYHTTLTAYSAKRALQAAAGFSPSVALLDLELPDMTGFQLAGKFRSHALSCVRRVPLIAVAESFLLRNSELSRAAGFVDCLTKPVISTKLSYMLRTLHEREGS